MNLSSKEEMKMRQESIFLGKRRARIRHLPFYTLQTIVDIINETEGKDVLDVGCGIGLLDLLIVKKKKLLARTQIAKVSERQYKSRKITDSRKAHFMF